MMIIIIGGDLAPTKSNINLFSSEEGTSLLDEELLLLWNEPDVRIFNLEAPLTDKESPINKNGPNLAAPISTIKGIKALNPSLLSLANNHIFDHGEQGLWSTEKILSNCKISYVGVGNNLNEASQPHFIEQEGLRIGVYACTEHEFSIATDTTPGANPFDPLESLDHIAALKSECDYVLVLYHGGKEHYRYPSPYLQKVCRKISQKGADMVVCQHSHCIGCYEEYEGSTIIYGQGNFIFDYSESEFWQTSLLLRVCISDMLKVDFIPIWKTGNTVAMASGKKAEDILAAFHSRSKEIIQDGFIERNYRKFAADETASYLRKFYGFSKWKSCIDQRLLNGMLIKSKYNSRQLLTLRNYIECEAHRELIIEVLRRQSAM